MRANVLRMYCRGGGGVRVAARALRVHVDQTHVVGAELSLEFTVIVVAFVPKPLGLRPPVRVVSLPDVGAAEGEPERLEAHRFQGAVAGEDDEVGPRQVAAVLLLDRPQQATRLVQVAVVRPAVQGRKALVARAAAAAAVGDAVRARGVPRHADEERPIVAVVCRPPVLGGRHHLLDVLLQLSDVNILERQSIVEVSAHRVRCGRVFTKSLEAQLIRPPGLVRSHEHCSIWQAAECSATFRYLRRARHIVASIVNTRQVPSPTCGRCWTLRRWRRHAACRR